MSVDSPVVLKQHTEMEWLAVKPHVERLYMQEHRPLSTVMREMEIKHRFRARYGKVLKCSDVIIEI